MGLVLLLLTAPLLQVLLVGRSPWGGPELVTLAVVWLAMSRGPVWGCVAGLAGGLAADVTPPADGTMGRTALVLAVTGLLAGRWQQGRPLPEGRRREGRPPLVGAASAALGVVLQAGAAVALGDEPWRSVVAEAPWTLAWTVALGALVSPVLLRRRRSPAAAEPRVAMRRV
ncbi:rod shape-determining protein MreD [Nonomuraea basaltis]|uniref:rod shape-determining protein MreD n=1 Tax=Nonomuraea basaltis TaxID=2495887 RepID=UPI00110C4031|nr:rod shape-determining protein MreD [Nonomuraea basaltis]TMR93424.1 rod shape-determining protein MreD [Nonomuraea basaltis]